MKTVVIGAGVSGISTALMLARYGHEVTLIEAGSKIAPLVRGFSRRGLHCDTGFHLAGALNKGGILNRYLEFLGVLPLLRLVPYREDCCQLFRFVQSDGREDICIPQGMRAAAKTLAGFWPEHGDAVARIFSAMETAFSHSPFTDPERMAGAPLIAPGGGKTVSMLEGMGLPGQLQSLLTACSIYYGVPPGRTLFEELALVTVSMREGVHGIEGGGAALARAYEQALASAGIRTLTGTAADVVLTDGESAVTAVRTAQGEEIPCQACVYTGHPARLPELLPASALRPAMARHLRTLEETPALFMAFAEASGDFLPGRDMVLCLNEDLDDAYTRDDPGKAWLHLCAGPPDASGRFILTICGGMGVPPDREESFRPPGYGAWKQQRAETLCALVRRHVPELGPIDLVEAATAYSLQRWVHGSSGAIYGAARNADTFPIPPLTRVKGLLLAGQSIILPGLLGATISGAVAAGILIGFPTLFKDLTCTSAE